MKHGLLWLIYRTADKVAGWAGRTLEKEQMRKTGLPETHYIHMIAREMLSDMERYPLAKAILLEAAFNGTSALDLKS